MKLLLGFVFCLICSQLCGVLACTPGKNRPARPLPKSTSSKPVIVTKEPETNTTTKPTTKTITITYTPPPTTTTKRTTPSTWTPWTTTKRPEPTTTTTTRRITTPTPKRDTTTDGRPSNWGFWSSWTQCPRDEDLMEGVDCPASQRRTRVCLAGLCQGLAQEVKACHYRQCKMIYYLHVRLAGYCNVPFQRVKELELTAYHPEQCADACASDLNCDGFTWAPLQYMCYMMYKNKYTCDMNKPLGNYLPLISYMKDVPFGYNCEHAECPEAGDQPTMIKLFQKLEGWKDCAKKCDADRRCKSFQWGLSDNDVIQRDDLWLNCYLFSSTKCSKLRASSYSRRCQRNN